MFDAPLANPQRTSAATAPHADPPGVSAALRWSASASAVRRYSNLFPPPGASARSPPSPRQLQLYLAPDPPPPAPPGAVGPMAPRHPPAVPASGLSWNCPPAKVPLQGFFPHLGRRKVLRKWLRQPSLWLVAPEVPPLPHDRGISKLQLVSDGLPLHNLCKTLPEAERFQCRG